MRRPEDKKKIMERKAKLKGKKIFIENDRTKKEREEQKGLKRRAWVAKNVKVGGGGIRLIFWNVAGIRNKDKEFWEFLERFDVIRLTETWVEEKDWDVMKNRLPPEWSWEHIPAER
ncbi:GSCOCG00011712001-RA-CDS, partial [Cotesia congregata]